MSKTVAWEAETVRKRNNRVPRGRETLINEHRLFSLNIEEQLFETAILFHDNARPHAVNWTTETRFLTPRDFHHSIVYPRLPETVTTDLIKISTRVRLVN